MNEIRLPEWRVLNAAYELVHTEWSYRDVCSPFGRLYYITEGHGTITTRNGVIDLQPGSIYHIPAFMLHSDRCDNCMGHYYVHLLEIADDTGSTLADSINLPYEIPELDGDIEIFRRLAAESSCLDLTDPHKYQDGPLFQQAMARACSRHTGHKLYMNALVALIMSRFIYKGRPTLQVSHPGLGKAMLHLQRNLCDNPDIGELAAIASLSRDYFSRLFKAATGMTPKHYVLRRHMKTAQNRLALTGESIKAIASSLGYDDMNYFSRLFRKYVGVTPSRYRRLVNTSPAR